MLRSTNWLLVLGILLCMSALVGGAWALGWIPTYVEYCEQNPHTYYKECATYNIALITVWQIGKFLDAIAAPLTGLATVAIGYFTYTLKTSTDRLWDAGEKARILSEDTAERQLRAYVFLDTINLPERIDPLTKKMTRYIQVAWKNTGGTRTRHFTSRVSHKFWELNQQPLETFDFSDESDAATFYGLIGPAQSVNPPPIQISNYCLVAASDEEQAFLIWGWAEYQDVFRPTIHRTEFAFRVLVEGNPLSRAYLIRFEPTQRHNAADDDCMKQPQTTESRADLSGNSIP